MEEKIIKNEKEIGKNISEKTHAFFDFFRKIDYFFQDKRDKLFIYGAFAIVIFAPLIDKLLLPQRLSLTSITTYLYLFFFLVSAIAWTGRFRDENNVFSYKRLFERLKISILILLDAYKEIKEKDKNSLMLILGIWVFIAGFFIKAFQNISEIFRIPFQFVGFKMRILMSFESYTHLGYILIFIGGLLLLYLHFSKRVNLIAVFITKKEKSHLIQLDIQNNFVVNTKNTEQIKNLIASNPDSIFRATINALLDWKPIKSNREKDYHIDVYWYLYKKLKQDKLSIAYEDVITSNNETGRIDLSINDSLYIELKKKIKSTESDRASGQILKYQRIIEKSSTPLILLIVDNDFEFIKDKMTNFIKDYNNNHIQKLLAVVVEPK